MFKPLPDSRSGCVTLTIDGQSLSVFEGQSVAAAVLAAGLASCRSTVVSGSPRLPYCMMGLCFDCLMEIDGVPNCQACLVEVREGMVVRRQQGRRGLQP